MATQEKVVIPVLISAVLAGQGPMKDSRSRKLVAPLGCRDSSSVLTCFVFLGLWS